MSRPFVSVILPTYQREAELCDTLRGLLAQDYPSYEVVVVDQTPVHTPATAAFLDEAKREHGLKYVFVETPSLPGARNVGMRAARGDVAIYFDDDIFVEPHVVSRHVEALESQDVGIVAGGLIVAERPDMGMPGQPTAHFLPDGRCTMGFGRSEPAFVQTAPGGNMAIRREVFEHVGPFDTQYVGNAFREESDFCFRARALGYRIYFEPRAAIFHRNVQTGGCGVGDLPLQLHDRFYNETRFFLKYFPLQDFPRFLWRNRARLLWPGTVRLAAGSGGLRALLAPHLGILDGIRSWRESRRRPGR